MKTSRMTSLLGVTLEGTSFSAVQLRSKSGKTQIERTLSASLSMDPFSSDTKAAGREIATQLRNIGIRERRCVACVPLSWILIHQMDLPDLPEHDVESYIAVHAERAFPFPLEELSLSTSIVNRPDGTRGVMISAVPTKRLLSLVTVLRAARLKVARISIGIASFIKKTARQNAGTVILSFADEGADMGIGYGDGIITLRRLSGTIDVQALHTQMKITLGQLPGAIREKIRRIVITDSTRALQDSLDSLRSAVKSEGMEVDLHESPHLTDIPEKSINGTLALLAAAVEEMLQGDSPALGFASPQKEKIELFLEKVSARRALWAAGLGIVLVLICTVMILQQKWKLERLEREWETFEPQVATAKSLQENIREVRSWYVDSPQTLNVLKLLTRLFPEKGTVWVTALRIKSSTEVSLTGRATRKDELLKVLGRLNSTEGITNLRVLQIQEPLTGKDQILFTITFDCSRRITDGT